ncbi:MAG: hypothetical protein Q8K13_04155 [Parvibaculum sp.]|uniref:hypothetical protein n=1 Tax=Parvibaculum sp. TaxID=2024848 RepID=UPI00272FECD0|nr:hypothetical protein [Parvibaculum sp.]MDP2148819.1 hypothetical protein [Parvibaculum sp.]
MALPQTSQIAQTQGAPVQSARTYNNVYRAELRGDGRTAGAGYKVGAEDFSRMVKQSDRAAEIRADSASKEGGGFIAFIKTVIDIINPLQHIPVISTMYRHITGDEISPVARIAGGALFGGPVGLAAGVVNAAVENSTGKDIGGNMLAMVTGSDKKPAPTKPAAPPVMLAAADIVWKDAPHNAVTTTNSGQDIAAKSGQDIAAKSGQDIEKQIRESRSAQIAALGSTAFPSSDTPTTLRTRTGGKNGPDGGSLPSEPPVLQAKKGMLAPTQTADRTHTGQATGAGRSTAPDVGKRNPATHPAEASPVLQSQDAPAQVARMATLPEQIASSSAEGERQLGIVSPVVDSRLVPQQMMAALDKYSALKKSQNAAAATGRLVPSFH